MTYLELDLSHLIGYNYHMFKKYAQILLVILLIALAWFAVTTVNRNISNAIGPLQQANNAMSTQISRLLNPTPTVIPDPVTIIHEVRSLARLETIQYSVEKIVTMETAARQTAEEEIRKAALEDGILALAQQNAETYLSRLFRALGFADVIFVQSSP